MSAIAYTVTSAAKAVGLSKPHIITALVEGDLVARRVGNEVIITARDLSEWITSQPIWVNARSVDVPT